VVLMITRYAAQLRYPVAVTGRSNHVPQARQGARRILWLSQLIGGPTGVSRTIADSAA